MLCRWHADQFIGDSDWELICIVSITSKVDLDFYWQLDGFWNSAISNVSGQFGQFLHNLFHGSGDLHRGETVVLHYPGRPVQGSHILQGVWIQAKLPEITWTTPNSTVDRLQGAFFKGITYFFGHEAALFLQTTCIVLIETTACFHPLRPVTGQLLRSRAGGLKCSDATPAMNSLPSRGSWMKPVAYRCIGKCFIVMFPLWRNTGHPRQKKDARSKPLQEPALSESSKSFSPDWLDLRSPKFKHQQFINTMIIMQLKHGWCANPHLCQYTTSIHYGLHYPASGLILRELEVEWNTSSIITDEKGLPFSMMGWWATLRLPMV